MITQQNQKGNKTQPAKDRHPEEDTFEQDNNTNVAAMPKSDLTTCGHSLEEEEAAKKRKT